jgi:hypothetical protein
VPTIFPQPLLLASSFDDSLAWQVRGGSFLQAFRTVGRWHTNVSGVHGYAPAAAAAA